MLIDYDNMTGKTIIWSLPDAHLLETRRSVSLVLDGVNKRAVHT